MNERDFYSILMVNLPFSGHTNPTLGLARVLTDMGHRVTYVAGSCGRYGRTFCPL